MPVAGNINITVLVEDSAGPSGSVSEHGLSLFIRTDDMNILFDTGQGRALEHNAMLFKAAIENTDLIVLSHGHYDHANGLPVAARKSPGARILIHRDALTDKYAGDGRYVGMSRDARNNLGEFKNVTYVTSWELVRPGMYISGTVPKTNDFEIRSGDFYIGSGKTRRDELSDDMSMAFVSQKGLIIITGCAHSGIINIVDHMRRITRCGHVHAVMGGFHLGNAEDEKISRTVEQMFRISPDRLFPGHCTGEKAMTAFEKRFGASVERLYPGKEIRL